MQFSVRRIFFFINKNRRLYRHHPDRQSTGVNRLHLAYLLLFFNIDIFNIGRIESISGLSAKHYNSKLKEAAMKNQTLAIPNITCGHCVMAIENELMALDGVIKVAGHPEQKTIDLEWDAPATMEKIREKLQEINYPAD